MTFIKKLMLFWRRWRGRFRRLQRLIFMSPAEARFVELMGGKVYRIEWLKHPKTKFPATIVWSLGKLLKSEKFKREVRYGRYFVDFANDLDRIIEVDGKQWHMDVVADMDREIYIHSRWPDSRILRIKAYKLYNDSQHVQQQVLKFLEGPVVYKKSAIKNVFKMFSKIG